MASSRTEILLIRHAEPAAPGAADSAENDRPLSERGMLAADHLAESLAGEKIAAIYSSPYLRAQQTVEPLARRLEKSIVTVDDLRERKLHREDISEWRAELARSFRDFNYAPAGGESSRAAQTRAVRALRALCASHEGETIVVASHGNLITLILASISPSIGFDFWAKLPMPALYRLVRKGDSFRIQGGPNLPKSPK